MSWHQYAIAHGKFGLSSFRERIVSLLVSPVAQGLICSRSASTRLALVPRSVRWLVRRDRIGCLCNWVATRIPAIHACFVVFRVSWGNRPAATLQPVRDRDPMPMLVWRDRKVDWRIFHVPHHFTIFNFGSTGLSSKSIVCLNHSFFTNAA